MLADDRRSWQLGTDAVWRRTEELTGSEGSVDTFAIKKAMTLEAAREGHSLVGPDPGPVAGPARMTVERPVEIELKYAVADRTIGERLLNAETLAGFRAMGAPRPTQHEDRYVDSADGALARAGFAARLRTAANDTIVVGQVDRRRRRLAPPARGARGSGRPDARTSPAGLRRRPAR